MKKRAIVFAIGFLLSISALLGADIQAEATQPGSTAANSVNITPLNEYLTMKREVEVHAAPGTSSPVIGKLISGQPAIAVGRTDNGWKQIYYIGAIGFIPGDAAQNYIIPTVEEKKIPLSNNMNINALGDSITFGDKLGNISCSWPFLLGNVCQAANVNNYGWNGSSIGGIHPDRFVDRYVSMDRSADVVFMFGGTNDYESYNGQGTTIGAMGDITPDSFYGALNITMCGLRQMYPDSEIIVMTPLRRVGYMRRNKKGYYLGQYVTAIQEMAAFYGIRVLDLYNEPELDFSAKSSLYLVDGLHPNEFGQAMIAMHVYRTLFEPEPAVVEPLKIVE